MQLLDILYLILDSCMDYGVPLVGIPNRHLCYQTYIRHWPTLTMFVVSSMSCVIKSIQMGQGLQVRVLILLSN